ncbi:hypothetical protein MMC13_003041 [Lambiella insularis]|nr:hypothetical protein [Lambiella insularis]
MISLPSGGLSTASFDIPVGSMFYNPNTRALSPSQGVTQAINVTDFACPTWGLGTPFLSLLTGSTTTYTYTRTMVTSPFNPIIVPPSQLLGLDPAWRSQCTGFYSYGEQLLQYDIYDPPFRLTPGGGLDPSTTPLPTPAPVSATMTSSWPSSLSTTAVPVPGSPSVFSPKTAVSISSVSHTSAASHTQNQPDTVSEISTGSSAPDPLDNPTTGQPLPSVSSLSSATAAPFISNLTFASTEGITNSETSQGIQSLQSTQKLGGIIFSAFEGGDVSTIDVQSSNGAIVTAGTQSVNVINPSAVVVNGATYTAGGPPATLSGGLISIAPIINTQLSVQTITAGGASSSAFDSTTSVAGKPGITYSGTVSSLSTGAGNGSASVKPFEGAQVKVEVSRDSRSLLGLGAWLIWAYWY